MSNTRYTAAPQRPKPQRPRRSSAVIAQYIQDLSQTARLRRTRRAVTSGEPRVFPARVLPVPCS